MRYRWGPYVSVASRRATAKREMVALRKKGVDIQPIEIDGRKIARTFWGQAWCDHLESFSDFDNRLPRGRTYVRNGSVCHLKIDAGRITAIVSGSDLYEIEVKIKPLAQSTWTRVKRRCAGQIGSILELLQGRLSSSVMGVVTDRREGLFPEPEEISLKCDCPDWATMCKHVAAVLYGVGARLDTQPDLLFLLRGVNHEELIAADDAVDDITGRGGRRKRLAGKDLTDVFGIDLADEPAANAKAPKKTARKTSKKKAAKKTATRKTPRATAKKKTAKKTTARKAPKATAKKKATKKTAARKTPKATAKKKAAAPKTPKTAAKRKAAKKAAAPKTPKTAAKRKAAKKAAAPKTPRPAHRGRG